MCYSGRGQNPSVQGIRLWFLRRTYLVIIVISYLNQVKYHELWTMIQDHNLVNWTDFSSYVISFELWLCIRMLNSHFKLRYKLWTVTLYQYLVGWTVTSSYVLWICWEVLIQWSSLHQPDCSISVLRSCHSTKDYRQLDIASYKTFMDIWWSYHHLLMS